MSLRDKLKHVFIVPIVRQVALDNVPLRNGPEVLKSFVKDLSSYYFTVRIDHDYPNKMIDFTVTGIWNLYISPKSGHAVLYDKCIRKSIAVCNLHIVIILKNY